MWRSCEESEESEGQRRGRPSWPCTQAGCGVVAQSLLSSLTNRKEPLKQRTRRARKTSARYINRTLSSPVNPLTLWLRSSSGTLI